MMAGPISTAAQPDRSGVAHLEGLVPGAYRISIHCPGSLPLVDAVEVGSAPAVREWTLQRGLSLSGRVETPSGVPVPGALVSVCPMGEPSDRLAVNCSTSPIGEFTCSGLSPGDYDCSVEDAGDPKRDVQRVVLSEGSLANLRLLTRPSGTIEVSVRPAHAGAVSPSVFARGPGVVPLEATPRLNGFVFERVPLGRYEVYVEVPTSGSLAQVELEHDGEVIALELSAPPSLSIEGRVVDESGAPFVDAWVSVSPTDVLARSATAEYPPALAGELGQFIVEGLSPGSYDLRIWNGSYEGELRGVEAGASRITAGVRDQRSLSTASIGKPNAPDEAAFAQ
jgi:hypothetical protein